MTTKRSFLDRQSAADLNMATGDHRAPDPLDLVNAGRWADAAAAYETILAEDGGADPLDILRPMIAFCREQLARGGQ